MCKEADEPENKGTVQVIIPENLPEPTKPTEMPANPIIPPQHTVTVLSNENVSVDKFEDLPLSDVNENSKAR